MERPVQAARGHGSDLMHRFLVFDEKGKPAKHWPLRNAYLIGSDGHAVPGGIRFDSGEVQVHRQDQSAMSLALHHRVGELGELTLQTCLLPAREKPYLLTLELARHRLMLLFTKLEDWGMFELEAGHVVQDHAARARELFIEALCRQGSDPAGSTAIAQQCLELAIDGSEELALTHAELLLQRRMNSKALPRTPMGCGIDSGQFDDRLAQSVKRGFDFVQVPLPWRKLTPEEDRYDWSAADRWVNWAVQAKLPVVAGPIICFEPAHLPQWVYIWEHDYDTLRDLIYEHVEAVVGRYRNAITAWKVVSGLHVNTHFSLAFEQLMDLTRMCVMLVKKQQPSARALVELRQPFGENTDLQGRSIPPSMYADLMVQSAIPFDALAIDLCMGQARPGQHTRDLMQIAGVLDHLAGAGKPLYLSASAPSQPVTSMMIADLESAEPVDPEAGRWRRPWSPNVQSYWLNALYQLSLSRPYIEAVVWDELIDHPAMQLPLSGLVDEWFRPKKAWHRLIEFRKMLLSGTTETNDAEPLVQGVRSMQESPPDPVTPAKP